MCELRTWYPQDEPISQIAGKVDYPVLIKPAIAAGARGITFCHSAEELTRAAEMAAELKVEHIGPMDLLEAQSQGAAVGGEREGAWLEVMFAGFAVPLEVARAVLGAALDVEDA